MFGPQLHTFQEVVGNKCVRDFFFFSFWSLQAFIIQKPDEMWDCSQKSKSFKF